MTGSLDVAVDLDLTTPHTTRVAQKGEQLLIADVQRRLMSTYAQLAPEQFSSAVTQARAHFEQSRVCDFVPLLVERRARAELAKTMQPAAAQ